MYLPFGKYNDDNIFINLSDERYCSINENDEIRSQYVILEKKENNLYQIVSNEYKKIDLEENSELGYLLSYDNDTVYISLVVYDKKHEKVSCKYNNKFTAFKSKMIEELEKHFIL